MAMNFPDAPSVDDEFTVGDQTWKWTGTVWETVTITSYTPSAHATSHELGGTDELALDPTQVTGLATLNTGTAGYTALSNGASGLSYQPVSHNYIINGAFDVWQRGTSFSADGYTADRFYWVKGSATGTVSKQTFTPADIEATGFGDAESFARWDITSGAQFTTFNQRIEDVRTLAGQTVTVSFWAKGTNPEAGYWTVNAGQVFGSGGSAAVFSNNASLTVTGSWQRYSFTMDIPSVTGKTIGAGSYLRLPNIYQPTASTAASTLDIWGVQLEAGSVATPFKRNAPSLQGELAACQRYYYRTSYAAERAVATPVFYTTDDAYAVMRHPVTMRAGATFFPSGSDIFDIDVAGTANIASNVVTANNIDIDSFLLRVGFVSTATQGYSGILYLDPAGYYEIDAEL